MTFLLMTVQPRVQQKGSRLADALMPRASDVSRFPFHLKETLNDIQESTDKPLNTTNYIANPLLLGTL